MLELVVEVVVCYFRRVVGLVVVIAVCRGGFVVRVVVEVVVEMYFVVGVVVYVLVHYRGVYVGTLVRVVVIFVYSICWGRMRVQ